MAFVHIAITDLRPGMYIVQTGESWKNRPYLYAKPGLVTNEKEIEEIIRQGFHDAYYDPEKAQSQTKSDDTLAKANANRVQKAQQIPIHEEISRQQKPYEEFVSHMLNVMEDARSGRVTLSAQDFIVQDIMQSMSRNRDALLCLSKLKTFDNYTYAHSVNVSILSIAFGFHLGMQGDDLHMLGLSGLFHDIGKMKIPPAILNAPRKLSPDEFRLIKRHPLYGTELLAKARGVDQCIIDGVLDHHERYNGSGYPNKRRGPEISAFGSILSICDVYDALTSKRVYKDPLSLSQALSIMYDMRGDAWDQELLEHFIKMIGIYPVGTPIALTGGFKGLVVQSNPQAPLYPTVVLCLDRNGNYLKKPERIDLAQQHDIQIIKAINTDTFPVDIQALLFEGNIQPL